MYGSAGGDIDKGNYKGVQREEYIMQVKEWREIHAHCMKLPCVYETRPFGEEPICYRIAGKIFAQLSTQEDWFKMTLKTNPEAALFYRSAYPGVIVRGYHCPPIQQPYWNTIDLKKFDKEKLYHMIDEAYFEVIRKLSKKEQKRLPAIAQLQFRKEDGEKQEKRINVYNGEVEVASGSYRFYDEETVEIEEVVVEKEYRRLGIGKELIRRLEADARIAGYRFSVLTIEKVSEEVSELCKKSKYKVIPNYGKYADIPDAVCMGKKL